MNQFVLFLALCVFGVGIGEAQKTKYVVIAMLDGARYTETFGDTSYANVGRMWNELRHQGTLYTQFYNNGKTETNPGHASILSGTWQYISNDGSEYSRKPSIFEYFRKEKNAPAADCWVVLGKDKLNVLARSTHAEYGAPYAASVRTSAEPANDGMTYDNIRFVLNNYKSRITIANFAKIDIEGHAGSWEQYIGGIKRADTLMASLWNAIQSDPELMNKTTLIITNDHGRHTVDFVNHGDGCDGCRHIMLLVLGPDTPKGLIDSTVYSQIDIAPTIGKMMRFSTPLSEGKVIESAIAAAANVPVGWKHEPVNALSGLYQIQWSLGPVNETVTTTVEYSRDAGGTWKPLLKTSSGDSVFQWDTESVPDGTRYRLRVEVSGDTSYGIVHSSHDFTINNPGNGAPDIVLHSFKRNVILSGDQTIQWSAADPEGDPLTISIFGSTDNGATWSVIAEQLPNSGEFVWDTRPQANSKFFRVKIVASDGTAATETVSPVVEVENVRQKLPSVMQKSGRGNGIVSVNIGDASKLTGDRYRISFGVFSPQLKHYTVENLTKNNVVLQNISFPGDGSEGPMFDGIRLAVTDYPEPMHNKDSTKWIKGASTLFTKVNLPELVLPEGNVQALPEAADYEIRISEVVADTSANYFGALETPLYYTVYNTTMNRKTAIVLSELSFDGKLSFGDVLYLFMKDSAGADLLSWEVVIDGEVNSVEPAAGDILRIATYKPITGEDQFEFTAAVTSAEGEQSIPFKYELSANYPNPFNPSTSIRVSIPSTSNVTVKIYDLLGREVSTLVNGIVHAGVHQFIWNAAPFSSGLYIYRLTAKPVSGSREIYTGARKMLLLK